MHEALGWVIQSELDVVKHSCAPCSGGSEVQSHPCHVENLRSDWDT